MSQDAMAKFKEAQRQGWKHFAPLEALTTPAAARLVGFARVRAGQEVREYHLDAELLHEFRQHGSQYPAYGSIVAGGANACVLHYTANNQPLRDGELVLIDAGCEVSGYAANREKATSALVPKGLADSAPAGAVEEFATPGVVTIAPAAGSRTAWYCTTM